MLCLCGRVVYPLGKDVVSDDDRRAVSKTRASKPRRVADEKKASRKRAAEIHKALEAQVTVG
jgi:hypothetical protein